MGFFSDLKADLSQAVDELLPQDEKTEAEEAAKEVEAKADAEAIKEEAEVISELPAEEPIAFETFETVEETEDTDDASHYDLEGMLEKALREKGVIVEDENGEEILPKTEEVIQEEVTETEEVVDMVEEEAIIEEPVIAEEPVTSEEPSIVIEEEKTEDTYKGANEMNQVPNYSDASDETAVISAGMIISGDVMSEGNLDLIGTVAGNVDIAGKLNITGAISGNSKASEIFADGAKIDGDITAIGSVKIGASSVVVGNIVATSAAIAGAVKGDIDVKGPVILDTSAIVMGNIKSKSVQINNGAVVEGMCSQCYAEVSPTSFFDDYKSDIKKPGKAK